MQSSTEPVIFEGLPGWSLQESIWLVWLAGHSAVHGENVAGNIGGGISSKE